MKASTDKQAHGGIAKPPAAALALVVAVSSIAALSTGASGARAALPEIRTSATNQVPACVTPDRLMAFLKTRNARPAAKFKDIARHYKTFGEAWRVRWDYAFFQMAVETNFLTYRQPNGRMGDVDPDQNNFAGIGTTGGGVPGDRFPDVKTGVHAQIQHLVVYSGERLAAPIAPRTQLKQDVILKASLELGRSVRFSDLARRWAVDKNYDKSIEWVASLYRSRFCNGKQAEADARQAPDGPDTMSREATRAPATGEPQSSRRDASTQKPTAHSAVRTIWAREGTPASAPRAAGPKAVAATGSPPPQRPREPAQISRQEPAREDTPRLAALATLVPTAEVTATAEGAAVEPRSGSFAKPAGLGATGLACTIGTASYGGSRSVLIKSSQAGMVRYTALSVLAGFERSMTESFIKARAPNGEAMGEFDSRDAALDLARTLCPAAEPQTP